jgi:hypothetical protein
VGVLVMNAVFILLVWVLYKLLRPVNRDHALLMVLLALAGATIGMLNQFTQGTVLLLLSGADDLKGFSAEQLNAPVMLLLDLQRQIGSIAAIFYGLWLFPLGYLVFRSGFFPRLLGVLLMIGCFGYLLLAVQRLLFPSYEAIGYGRYAAHVAELSWLFWLLIKGVDVEQWKARARESDV